MAAYAYPIKIDRNKQTIWEDVEYRIDDNALSIELLKPLVGNNRFTVQEGDYADYVIIVHTHRLETDDELATRVAKQEAYMVEYNKRKIK